MKSLKGRWFWLFGPYCILAGILAAARDEYANAQAALTLVEEDSHLGFEPDMDYVGGPDQIRWKIRLMEKLYPGLCDF